MRALPRQRETLTRALACCCALVVSLLIPSSAALAHTQVSIQNFSFQPPTACEGAGDFALWTNHDPVEHSIHWTTGGLAD